MSSKKVTYLKKTVSFQGRQLVMFSIDGATWSSRKEELQGIIERHELERQNFGGQIKGGPQVKLKPEGAEESDNVKRIEPKLAKASPVSNKEKSRDKIKDKKGAKVLAEIKPASKSNKKKLPEPKKRATPTAKQKKSTKSKRKVA